MESVKEYLQKNILVFDGGMGTYFASKNHTYFEKCEMANITNPEQIYDIHTQYIKSGCKAIKTNTFAANTDNFDYDSLKNIIENGWNIAKSAVNDKDVFVFADIGPVIKTNKNISEKYIETANIFINLGAENFIIETLYNYDGIYELTEHIKTKNKNAFIIVSFAVQPDGYTKDGCLGYELIKNAFENKYIDFVGLNCVSGPQHIYEYFKTVKKLGNNFSIMPNAGYPTVINNRTFFESNALYFASKINDIVKEGAKIVGGCCGTTPEYIKETVIELNTNFSGFNTEKPNDTKRENTDIIEYSNDFYDKLKLGKKVIAVELDPPLTPNMSKFDSNAMLLKNVGVDMLTIADCPIAKPRVDSSILACRVKQKFGLNTLPHITCRDRNINATKALLLGLNIQGVNNVLVVTGDPIPSAMRDEVKSVFNFNSRMLAKYITTLNDTIFENKFLISAALNINAINFDMQLKIAKEKEINGVSVFLTQPVMTKNGFENIKRAKKELNSKILAGIMPVVSYKNACFMESEISGINVASEIIDMFKKLNKEESIETGIKIAVDIAEKVEPFCDGYYIITPFGRADIVCRIIESIKR